MKTMVTLAFALLICSSIHLPAQELPRRVYVGIKMENLTEDSRKIIGLGDLRGVLVAEVLSQSTAEKAGLKKGDVLLSINDIVVSSTTEVFAVLAKEKGGQPFNYSVFREKEIVKGSSAFKTFPEEKYPDLDVVYTETKSALGLQRIIITKPKNKKKLPVIAFIGGIGCYSLDFPNDSSRSEIQLMNTLSRAGYLCARLEKSGMGDNANYSKPCDQISFMEETDGYVQAIRTLKMREDVDSSAVYVFGHSMGGVFAPLVAQKTSLKGIIAYGTLGSNFIEYLAKTRRTIAEAYSMSPEETDDLIKDFCECSAYYFVEKMSSKEAAQKKEVCREYLPLFDLRARAYNDELYSLNVPGVWKSFTGKALLVWGQSDFISAKDDHEILSNAVNYYHKGNGDFLMIKNADHGMNSAASFQEARTNPGPYNPEVGRAILSWLQKHDGNS